MYQTIESISDSELREEYVKRFTRKTGARLGNARSSAEHLRAFLSDKPKDREHFVTIFLDSQLQVIDTELISSGSLSTAAVFPREIIKRLLALEAGAIIVGHNHPSGSTSPSSSDRALTKKLSTALESIDAQILDHLVLGSGDNFFSFSDQRLL
ncbi:MAG: DNA repair protein [Candidatus Marinimicrobia bacterium]|jgi:DNA repair protein RadC|nr:DNA repair protein [Candidatus Neomarinimicrobiota bacterium]MBT3576155.1 DNA repair protein [Candidatus Neomarinimicrobiota bacterium]MBT3679337.1 DNA repair protein [Candidatus Neomarinimicrobiota bacterium]MBT4253351.1 DNA repair protein [Candidatus Neomarinimicrobiota bacterium]MBT5235440.1 DNA repair protein [Candidatus Neomarinimicrobiota bacterium]